MIPRQLYDSAFLFKIHSQSVYIHYIQAASIEQRDKNTQAQCVLSRKKKQREILSTNSDENCESAFPLKLLISPLKFTEHERDKRNLTFARYITSI